MRLGATSMLTFCVLTFLLCAAAQAADIKRYDVPTDASPSIGPEGAEITIIEFIDYQ